MKLIDKILIALIITLVIISAVGHCTKKKVAFVSNQHAITEAIERYRINELQLIKRSDSLERETLIPKYKYLRGKIVYKHQYDTLTITQYVRTTDSIISVDSSLIAVQDSIIKHYIIYTNDLVIVRDSLIESNIDLTEQNAKYIKQKKRRLSALFTASGILIGTWLIILF